MTDPLYVFWCRKCGDYYDEIRAIGGQCPERHKLESDPERWEIKALRLLKSIAEGN